MIAQAYPVVNGQPLAPVTMRLDSQQTPVRGVLVDNTQSTLDVAVYDGISPVGTPYVVKAGRMRSVPVVGSNALYLEFRGVATADGTIYVMASPDPSISGTSETATIAGGTVDANISGGTLDAITNPVTQVQISDYPAGALAFATGIRGRLPGPLVLTQFNNLAGAQLFLSFLRVQGMSVQNLAWSLSAQGASQTVGTSPPVGIGDVTDAYPHPLFLATLLSSTASILLLTGQPVLGTPDIAVTIAGYTLSG